MSIVFGVLLFSIIIFLHELGHFVAAKLSGVQVNEFALFMGPAIIKKQVGETLYSIRCIPIGGYCAMEGEDEQTDNPRSFQKAAWWKRLIILLSGVAMNFVTGVALLAIVYAPVKQFSVPVISFFEEGCTLNSEAGLQVGDRFLEIDGEKIIEASDFSLLMELNPGDLHDIVVERSGEKITLTDFPMVKAEFPNPDGGKSIRYGFSFSQEPATVRTRLTHTLKTAVNFARQVRLSLQMLLNGRVGLKEVGGPVQILDQMAQVADASRTMVDAVLNMLYFGAFIAVNLAVMNLLPIPALDGGRVLCLLLTTLVEAVTRKKINPKYEAYLHAVGMILLLGLMGLILFKDIFTIIKR